MAYLCKGDFERALSEIEVCRRLEDAPDVTAMLGYTYARLGRHEEARQVITNLQELERYQPFSPLYYAPIFVALGEHDRALDCLEKAYRERSMRLVELKISPLLAPLRSSPRFVRLLKDVGLEK
jgi:tetratricopeptide (TPR) repeat protein